MLKRYFMERKFKGIFCTVTILAGLLLLCVSCKSDALSNLKKESGRMPPPGITWMPLLQSWLSNQAPPLEKATACVWHDQEGLKFYVVMEDWDIFTRATEDDQTLCSLGDTVEFFIKPGSKQERYYEIHISPNNLIMDVCIPSRQKMRTGEISWDEMLSYDSDSKREVTVYGDENKWTVNLCSPWKAFGLQCAPQAGSIWRFAVCRYNYSSATIKPELSSTACFSREDFHEYEDYNNLNF